MTILRIYCESFFVDKKKNGQQCWVLRYWLRETVLFLSLIWFLSLEIHQRRLSSDTCYWLCHNINTEMDKIILNTCLQNRKRKWSRMYRALLFIILHCFPCLWFDFVHSKDIESVFLVPLVSLKLMETWRVSFQSHYSIDFVVTLTCR